MPCAAPVTTAVDPTSSTMDSGGEGGIRFVQLPERRVEVTLVRFKTLRRDVAAARDICHWRNSRPGDAGTVQTAVTKPPFGLSVAPTKYAAWSEARKAAAEAISSGVARRPAGTVAAMRRRLAVIASSPASRR